MMTPKMFKVLFSASVIFTVYLVMKELMPDTSVNFTSSSQFTCAYHKFHSSISFPSQLVSVLLYLRSFNITIVMLEPFLILQLYLLSDKNESTWPISSEIMRSITDKKFGNSLITLGVMEELSDQLINLTYPVGWSHSLTKADDSRSNMQIIAHHWLIHQSVGLIIHLPVLLKRGNEFIWVAEVNLDKTPLNFTSLPLPYPIAFTMKRWKVFNWCQNVDVIIPDQLDYFLWQMPFMQFQECDRVRVESFKRMEKPNTDLSWDERCSGALHAFNNFMLRLKIPTWIVGGTLLGWYRQCGVISYTSDLDFATNISLISPIRLTQLKNSSEVVPKIQFGQLRDSLELTYHVPQHRVKVDLFFHTENPFGNGTFLSGMWPQKKMRLRWEYPNFQGICSVELLGSLCYAPCNPHDFIQADYGIEWPLQQKNYIWFKSHKNLAYGDVYTDLHWPSAMQTFP